MSASKKTIAVVATVFAVAAAGGAVAWYRGRGAKGAQTGHAEAEYFCPMHPQIVRDKPGECPVCGMKLERRSKGPAAGAPTASAEQAQGGTTVPGRVTVTLPLDRVKLLGIRSEPVGSGASGGTLRTVGSVALDERRREVVHAKYEGYVEELYVDFTGKPVRKGQPLLSIYSPELVAAQQEYLIARRAQGRLGDSSVPGVAQGGRDLAEASRQRLRYFDVGPAEIVALEQTGAPRRTVTLRSPVSGVVIEKMAVEGMKVSPADRLYEIGDLSRVWILADVYEKDLGAVRTGLPARVTLPHQPGRDWRGRVAFVSPTVKPETRTLEVRIEVDNVGGVLRPDMFTDVYLEGGTASVLTVPENAVIRTGERDLVFVDKGEGRFEPREIGLGARVPGGYAVLSGVTAGERVVVSANFLLDSESSLRAAISGLAGGH